MRARIDVSNNLSRKHWRCARNWSATVASFGLRWRSKILPCRACGRPPRQDCVDCKKFHEVISVRPIASQ
jgi:hypothetical protein